MPDNKLTIVQILPALQSGGVERGTLEVGKYLVEQGHRSIVISAGGRMVEQLQREGSEHVQWDIGRKSLWTLRLIPRLRRFLTENKVDILHARSRMPAWIAYLAWINQPPGSRPRFITTVHGLYSVNAYSAVMTRGERVIAVSETIRDYVLRNYPKTDPGRIVVIPRGIDPRSYPFGYQPDATWLTTWQAQYPQLAGKKLITLPGRITRLKGHEAFIDLIARLKRSGLPIHGIVVGGASANKQRYLDELMAKVSNLGLAQDITFTGQRNDMREILSISSIVLSLSSHPESFGRTTLEALSLGVPALGWDHGGVAEQLKSLLPEGRIAAGKVDQLAARVEEWLVKPPDIPREHGFTLQNMLDATLTVYRSALTNNN